MQHIQLAMGKARICIIDASNFECLALHLVNGHRKTEINGKLKAFEFEWIFTCYHWNFWNLNNITSAAASQNFTHNMYIYKYTIYTIYTIILISR